MKYKQLLPVMICTVALAAVVITTSPAHGKKKSEQSGLKKVIAIGQVEMGGMGFESAGPGSVADMMRQRAKTELEKTGRYAVVLTKSSETSNQPAGTAEMEEMQNIKPPSSASDMQAVMAQMRQLQKQMAVGSASRSSEPVAAQALFNFAATKGSGGLSTGGIFSTAESYGAPSGIGDADFSTDSIRVDLTCVMLDPETGRVVDQHDARASTAKFARVGGATYYTMEDSSDPDRAFDRMFKRALSKCIDWIDDRMDDMPWEAQVFKAKGSELYVNAGTSAGVSEGMTFDAYSREEVSGKGITVGAQDSKTGTVRISKAFDSYAVATPISGTARTGSVLKQSSN